MTDDQELSDHLTDNMGHDWHLFDVLNDIECRQLVGGVYQLKNKTHFVTFLSKAAFDSYLEDTTEDIWEDAHPLGTEDDGIEPL